MRSFFSWIGDTLFSTATSGALTPFVLAMSITTFSSIFLYISLQKAQEEKEFALEQVATLEKTVSLLKKVENADNNAAQHILYKNDIWNDINIKTALAIAELPRLEWEQPSDNSQAHLNNKNQGTLNQPHLNNKNQARLKNNNGQGTLSNSNQKILSNYQTALENNDQKYLNNNKQDILHQARGDNSQMPLDSNNQGTLSNYQASLDKNNQRSLNHYQASLDSNSQACLNNSKQAYLNNRFVEQKRLPNESKNCSIDTVLPHLSAPLIMLYEEVSRTSDFTAASMARRNATSTRTPSQEHDSQTARTVDKRTSYNLR